MESPPPKSMKLKHGSLKKINNIDDLPVKMMKREKIHKLPSEKLKEGLSLESQYPLEREWENINNFNSISPMVTILGKHKLPKTQD